MNEIINILNNINIKDQLLVVIIILYLIIGIFITKIIKGNSRKIKIFLIIMYVICGISLLLVFLSLYVKQEYQKNKFKESITINDEKRIDELKIEYKKFQSEIKDSLNENGEIKPNSSINEINNAYFNIQTTEKIISDNTINHFQIGEKYICNKRDLIKINDYIKYPDKSKYFWICFFDGYNKIWPIEGFKNGGSESQKINTSFTLPKEFNDGYILLLGTNDIDNNYFKENTSKQGPIFKPVKLKILFITEIIVKE